MAKPQTPRLELRPVPGPGAGALIEQACHQAVAGKRALRQLADWAAAHGLAEAELRVLWLLSTATDASPAQLLDQAGLAERLVASPAQISAVVERLRHRNLAACAPHPADRRRQLWQLTPAGRALVHQVVAAIDARSPDSAGRAVA
jgi:DNA-binding MarR family transcriptional regulator